METTQAPKPPADSKPVSRHPLVALVLSFVAPGLGHLYVGKPVLAFALGGGVAIGMPLLIIAWSLIRYDLTLFTIVGRYLFPVAAFVIAIWAALLARQRQAMVLERWQRPLGYGTFFLVFYMTLYLMFGYVKENYAHPIVLQNDAVAPELRSGDMVWLLKTKESKRPVVGAYALFSPTESLKPQLFVRIEAVNPDKVAVKDGAVFINGERKFDAPGAKDLAEVELGVGQSFGIANGRDPAKNLVDSRDVGPLRTGDYLGSAGVVIEGCRGQPAATCKQNSRWLVPR